MRDKFQKQLERLDAEIINLGHLCEDEIEAAISVLLADKDEKMQQVREYKFAIEAKSQSIENLCKLLLISQQPVASDLNTISNALKLIRDMNRIGAQALEMADIALDVEVDSVKYGENIRIMSHTLKEMVSEAVQAFVKKNKKLSNNVIQEDDILDTNYIDLKQKLKDSVFSDKEETSSAIDILMVAKYLERIGDHAVNIAEWVDDIT